MKMEYMKLTGGVKVLPSGRIRMYDKVILNNRTSVGNKVYAITPLVYSDESTGFRDVTIDMPVRISGKSIFLELQDKVFDFIKEYEFKKGVEKVSKFLL